MSQLIVYVPGLGESPDRIQSLYERLEPEFGTTVHLYKYEKRVRLFSRGTLAESCGDLASRIDAAVDFYKDVDNVILIGHSMGGLMIRRAYLDALAARRLKKEEGFAWVEQVKRIVLLAAPNRGFDLKRLSWLKRPAARLLAALPVKFTCKDALVGSAFVSDLRIRWIRELKSVDSLTVVQVLGDKDRRVDYEDSRDVQGLPNGAQMSLPRATHRDIVDVDAPEDIKGQRLHILKKAILEPLDPKLSKPTPLSAADEQVKVTVFALHGIRAGNADWPHQLGALLAQDPQLHVVTPSYGRMSAFSFALPWARRRHLRWFADQYTFYLVRNPKMTFHFVGHSNGTYIFGQSLARISGLEFDRVFLAGSVLPRNFAWQVEAENRIKHLVNVCATKDKPVAWLCSALRGLQQRDVGVGGFQGFDLFAHGPQIRWIEGGHGAAFAGGVPPNTKCTKCGAPVPESSGALSTVVEFLRGNDVSGSYHTVQPSSWFAWISRMAPYLAVIVLGLIALGVAAVVISGATAGAAWIIGALALLALILKTI
jgi:pimeloyl-ACP methyl ester carboxylesterase